MTRLSTGIPGLDEKIGGGLLPGTMTVLFGSSGIGKTQLGLQFLAAAPQEKRGVIFDMTARGDSQNHAECDTEHDQGALAVAEDGEGLSGHRHQSF